VLLAAGVNNLRAGCQQKRCVHAAAATASGMALSFRPAHACGKVQRESRAHPRTHPRVQQSIPALCKFLRGYFYGN